MMAGVLNLKDLMRNGLSDEEIAPHLLYALNHRCKRWV
jgi:hypothetical protein